MEFDRKTLTQHRETAERYHRNLTPEVSAYLESRGITEPVATQFRLGVCDDLHNGWLSIPYLRPPGVIWFNYRRLDSGTPKYMSPGKKHLYNTVDLDLADSSGEIALCEGEIDTITASALCDVPTVGIPGATQWTGNKNWRELFRGYERVWVLADPDEAGLSLAEAIMNDLPAARLVRLPFDVNECYVKGLDLKGFMK